MDGNSAELLKVVLTVLGTIVAVTGILVPVAIYIHRGILETMRSGFDCLWRSVESMQKSIAKLDKAAAVITTHLRIKELGEREDE